MLKLDTLAFAAHPDDTELSCSGTLLSMIDRGLKVGVVDFTRGEMGTRGTPEIRDKEAAEASKILGLTIRENLSFKDVFFSNDDKHTLEVVKKIRQYQPKIVLANALKDRHPDHSKAAEIVKKAIFWAGLKNLKTTDNNQPQDPWKVDNLYHYIQTDFMQPSFVVDVTNYWDKRMEAVRAFKSQFYQEGASSDTLISSPEFMEFIEARAREFGLSIRTKYGEGFVSERNVGISDMSSLL